MRRFSDLVENPNKCVRLVLEPEPTGKTPRQYYKNTATFVEQLEYVRHPKKCEAVLDWACCAMFVAGLPEPCTAATLTLISACTVCVRAVKKSVS